MCEPTTLIIAATAMQTAGQIVQGVNTAKQMRYSAKINEINANMDRKAAQDALDRGRIEEQRQYRRNSQRMGAIRAAQAANGIETEFGSASDVQFDAKQIGWEDADTIRQNAAREATGFEINAWNREAQAKADRAGAKAAMWNTVFDVGSTILGGAQQYRKAKAPQASGG